MSDSSHMTRRSSVSAETASASWASDSVASSMRSTSSSVPEYLTNAAVTRRCSASTAPSSIGTRSAGGTSSESPSAAAAGSSGSGGSSASPASGRRRKAPSRSEATKPSSASTVRADASTSPDSAASSSSSVAEAVGPQTMSSRWWRPSRKKWHSPETSPAHIDSSTGPTLDSPAAPPAAMNRCIASAAHAARLSWPSPSNTSRSASPRNFSTSPP